MADAAIRVRGLKKRYAAFRKPLDALLGVDLEIARGDAFGFLGPNGAGKTTTIRILATILSPTAGSAEVGGHDIREDPMAVRSLIGYMPENAGGYPLMTGQDNLLYWARLQDITGSGARERAKSLLATVGLEEAAGQKVKTYSHGMKKRLLMASALIHDPEILLLDEPAGGLDPQGIRFFRDLIHGLRQKGKTVFLSSHILSEVEQTCSTIGIIQKGRMVAVDRVEAIRQRVGAVAPARVEVDCDPPSASTVQLLRQIPKVRMVWSTPAGILVEAEPGADVADEITRVLVTDHVRIRAIRPFEPTLEDAFLSLLGGAPS